MRSLTLREALRQLAQRGIRSRVSTSSASVLRSLRKTPPTWDPTRWLSIVQSGFARAAQCCREVIAHVENDYVARIRFADGDGGAVCRSVSSQLAKAEKPAFL